MFSSCPLWRSSRDWPTPCLVSYPVALCMFGTWFIYPMMAYIPWLYPWHTHQHCFQCLYPNFVWLNHIETYPPPPVQWNASSMIFLVRQHLQTQNSDTHKHIYIYILLYYYYNGIGKSSSYNMRILVPGKSRAGYHAFRVFYMTMIVLWDQKRLKNRLEDYGDSI